VSATAEKTNGRARVPRVALTVPQAPEPAAPETRSTPHLDAAVLAVQAAAPKLVRNATGQIQNRTYGYTSLDAVMDVILPLLVEHELLWKAFPTIKEGEPGLRYTMTHLPSGEFDEDVMSLMIAVPNPQGQGSGITYARRYSLFAYLNLTVDSDDDGAGASAQNGNHETRNGQRETQSVQPTARPPAASDRPASAKQRGMLQGKGQHLPRGDFANIILEAAGEPPRVWADEDAAVRWIKRGLDRLPAKHVDAVLAGIAKAPDGGTER
jgi:hypothetical protein